MELNPEGLELAAYMALGVVIVVATLIRIGEKQERARRDAARPKIEIKRRHAEIRKRLAKAKKT